MKIWRIIFRVDSTNLIYMSLYVFSNSFQINSIKTEHKHNGSQILQHS